MNKKISHLLKDLSNYGKAREAAQELADLGLKAVVPLIDVLKKRDNTPVARVYSAITLGEIGDNKAVPYLINLLEDYTDSWEVRRRVAWALGKIGDKNAERSLMVALEKDSSPDVRGFAAESLGMMKIEKAIPLLVASLTDMEMMDDFTPVAYKSVKALGEIGGPDAEKILIEVIESWLPCSKMDETAPIFHKFLGIPPATNDDVICSLAAQQLGKCGNIRILPKLERLHKEAGSEIVKKALEQAIAKLKQKG